MLARPQEEDARGRTHLLAAAQTARRASAGWTGSKAGPQQSPSPPGVEQAPLVRVAGPPRIFPHAAQETVSDIASG